MPDALDLRRYGPWALVTGASSGIGEQVARHLARAGLNVVLVARRAGRLAALKDELVAAHDIAVEFIVEDLGEPQAVDRVLAAVGQRDIGLLVSNAGFGLKGPFSSHAREQVEAMFNVNARAPLLLLHGLMPRFSRRRAAGIILTGSQEGETPFPWSSAYAATKAFVHSLGQGLYGECRGTGIDVLVLAPGATDTEALRLQGFDPQALSGLMRPADVAWQALGRLGRGPLHVPGRMNRVFVTLLRRLPRRWAIALAGQAMATALRQAGHPVPGPKD